MIGYALPRLPVSVGALLWDDAGRLLILKPTYKAGWTLPGGQVEEDGETPWEGCRREVLEETGIVVRSGVLVCVDFLRPRPTRPDGRERPGGLRLLFDCGVAGPPAPEGLVLQAEEIEASRWVDPDEAPGLLSGPVGRRVRQALAGRGAAPAGGAGPRYLEDGRAVDGVG